MLRIYSSIKGNIGLFAYTQEAGAEDPCLRPGFFTPAVSHFVKKLSL